MKFLLFLLGRPLLHFFLIGGILFLLSSRLQHQSESSPTEFPQGAIHQTWNQSSAVQQQLTISSQQIELLKKDITLQTGTRPTQAQLDRLVQTAIDDELLYREALALGLDQDNVSVKMRLVELARMTDDATSASDDALYKKALDLGLDRHDLVVKRILIGAMQLVAKKLPTRSAPGTVKPEDVKQYYQANADSFTRPMQVKFTHLYFSRDKRGSDAEADAQRLWKEVSTSGLTPERVAAESDPFLGGQQVPWNRVDSLERTFGTAFSKALQDAVSVNSVGKWVGPVASSYGWHLVYIENVRPERPAYLSEVENTIVFAIKREREVQRLAELLTRLRKQYEIVVHAYGEANA